MTQQQKETIENLTKTPVKELNTINSKFLAKIPNYSKGSFKKDPFVAGLKTTQEEGQIHLSIQHRMTSTSNYIINKDGTIIKEY